MVYSFDIFSGRRGLGSADIELNDREVQTIKNMIKETGDFTLGDLEEYDADLFEKILDITNSVAEMEIRQIFKEEAEACGEPFDEENFEVDWQNENIDIACPEEFF